AFWLSWRANEPFSAQSTTPTNDNDSSSQKERNYPRPGRRANRVKRTRLVGASGMSWPRRGDRRMGCLIWQGHVGPQPLLGQSGQRHGRQHDLVLVAHDDLYVRGVEGH